MKIFDLNRIISQFPNLFLKNRLEFEFEMLPFVAKHISKKKLANFFVAGLNQYLLPSRPLGFPVIAQVEPTNYCNLSCPLCLTTSENKSRPKAALALDTFKRFIDDVGD